MESKEIYERFANQVTKNKTIWQKTKNVSHKYNVSPSVKISNITDDEFFAVKLVPNTKHIKVFNEDILTTARLLITKKYVPLILNMANANVPGGGVGGGVMREEEEIFRRSNYNKTLLHDLYPISDDEVIISPTVTVFKDKQYNDLDNTYEAAFIACPAVRQPKLTSIDEKTQTYADPIDGTVMREKINMIFKSAIRNGYDCVLLSALGCGSCMNPRARIVEFFNDAIRKYPIRYVFFAIKGVADPLNPIKDDNYEYFCENINRY